MINILRDCINYNKREQTREEFSIPSYNAVMSKVEWEPLPYFIFNAGNRKNKQQSFKNVVEYCLIRDDIQIYRIFVPGEYVPKDVDTEVLKFYEDLLRVSATIPELANNDFSRNMLRSPQCTKESHQIALDIWGLKGISTRTRILCYLVFSQIESVNIDNISGKKFFRDIVVNHFQKNTIDDVESGQLTVKEFFSPIEMMRGEQESVFISCLMKEEKLENIKNYLSNEEYRDAYLKTLQAYQYEDYGLHGKDLIGSISIDTIDFSKLCSLEDFDFSKIPLKYKEFRDCLFKQRISDFRKIIANVPANLSPEMAVEVTEKIVRTGTKDEVLSRLVQSFSQMTTQGIGNGVSIDQYQQMFNLYTRNVQHDNIVEFITQYVNDNSRFDEENFERLLIVLSILKWTNSRASADYIIGKLLCSGFSSEEVVNTIIEFSNSPHRSIKLWRFYLDNLDNCRDLPVSWVVEMVKL